MYSEARRLQLVKEVMMEKSETVLLAIERILKDTPKKNSKKKPSIYDFVGMLNHTDADDMRKAIAECCEIIDENDWK